MTQMQTVGDRTHIRQGFIFLESDTLKLLDETVLNQMKSSFAIVTHDIKVRELFLEIVAKARASVEADEKSGGKWSQILNCAVLVIAKEDFDDLKGGMASQVDQPTEKVSDLDFLIN